MTQTILVRECNIYHNPSEYKSSNPGFEQSFSLALQLAAVLSLVNTHEHVMCEYIDRDMYVCIVLPNHGFAQIYMV